MTSKLSPDKYMRSASRSADHTAFVSGCLSQVQLGHLAYTR
jgi:hypothetical protein